MKKIFIFWMMISLVACSNNKQKLTAGGQDTVIYYPYTPIYSELEKGKPSYAKTVLDVWRAYETGSILSTAKKFSDSLKLIFEDTIFWGKRDSILSLFQQRRNAYTDVQAYVDSWLPVHAKEANTDLVFIWGRLDCTTKNKKRDYLVVHEIWKFDTSGKIREMAQYLTHPH
jgi:hypothetical protein